MSIEAIRAAMAADGAADVIPVNIPQWPGVHVRAVSLAEGDRTARAAREKFGEDGYQESATAFAAAMVICDETGKRVFDPLSEDDLAFLSARRSRDIQTIINAATGATEKN